MAKKLKKYTKIKVECIIAIYRDTAHTFVKQYMLLVIISSETAQLNSTCP